MTRTPKHTRTQTHINLPTKTCPIKRTMAHTMVLTQTYTMTSAMTLATLKFYESTKLLLLFNCMHTNMPKYIHTQTHTNTHKHKHKRKIKTVLNNTMKHNHTL